MIVKFELKVSDYFIGPSLWLHRGTLILPDQTSDRKVIRTVKEALKLSDHSFKIEKTTDGWNIEPLHMIAVGFITIAF